MSLGLEKEQMKAIFIEYFKMSSSKSIYFSLKPFPLTEVTSGFVDEATEDVLSLVFRECFNKCAIFRSCSTRYLAQEAKGKDPAMKVILEESKEPSEAVADE